jgi:hypothetical protein
MGKPFGIMQAESVPLFQRELPQHGVDLCLERLVGGIYEASFLLQACRGFTFLAEPEGALLGEREGRVERDPVDPGSKGELGAVPREPTEHPKKGFLGGIFSLLGIPENPQEIVVEGALVAGHEIHQGVAVLVVPEAQDQVLVRWSIHRLAIIPVIQLFSF